MAAVIDLADAIVGELNGDTGDFAPTLEFTAERQHLPHLFVAEDENNSILKELETLHVLVVPSSIEVDNASRGSQQKDFEIHVGIQQRLSLADQAAFTANVDGLMNLAEEIADHFIGLRSTDPEAVCVGTKNKPIYDPAHLQELQVFSSVVALHFRRLA